MPYVDDTIVNYMTHTDIIYIAHRKHWGKTIMFPLKGSRPGAWAVDMCLISHITAVKSATHSTHTNCELV